MQAGRAEITAKPFAPGDERAWDDFVATCPAGTFLHTRRFLGYHAARFKDCSLQFFDGAGRLCGVMPAAVGPEDPDLVVSHPGATYAGLLHNQKKYGLDVIAMLAAARAHYAGAGFRRLQYKSVPSHFHSAPSQIDLYALWRAGAHLVRRDLWNVIDLTRPRKVDEARRRRLRRARDCGIRVVKGGSADAYDSFHLVLTQCLAERHAAAPVHSLEEMKLLQSLFEDRIALWLAFDASGSCLAGEWIFDCGESYHGQYGAATESGRDQSAQDLLLETIIEDAARRGVRCFSFGASTQDAGRTVNEGLFRYKASFGAGAVVHDSYELDLRPPG
jgi:hypothetical protein